MKVSKVSVDFLCPFPISFTINGKDRRFDVVKSKDVAALGHRMKQEMRDFFSENISGFEPEQRYPLMAQLNTANVNNLDKQLEDDVETLIWFLQLLYDRANPPKDGEESWDVGDLSLSELWKVYNSVMNASSGQSEGEPEGSTKRDN